MAWSCSSSIRQQLVLDISQPGTVALEFTSFTRLWAWSLRSTWYYFVNSRSSQLRNVISGKKTGIMVRLRRRPSKKELATWRAWVHFLVSPADITPPNWENGSVSKLTGTGLRVAGLSLLVRPRALCATVCRWGIGAGAPALLFAAAALLAALSPGPKRGPTTID